MHCTAREISAFRAASSPPIVPETEKDRDNVDTPIVCLQPLAARGTSRRDFSASVTSSPPPIAANGGGNPEVISLPPLVAVLLVIRAPRTGDRRSRPGVHARLPSTRSFARAAW